VWQVLRREEGQSVPAAALHTVTDAVAALRKLKV
jgi:hypothetical protein